jgi:hypothetical protein
MTPRPSIKTPGAVRVGSFRGAPIDVHWSALFGMFLFSGAGFAPAYWLAWLLIASTRRRARVAALPAGLA